jgi:hypothetical protein
MEQQQALFPSSSTLNLTTGRSGASDLLQRRFLGASLRECVALWRVFLATFGILPVLATPMPSCQLAGRVAVALMPSPKAPAPVWIALLDRHLGVAVSNGLTFTPLACTNPKFFRFSWGSDWPIARRFFHYALTTVRPLNLSLFFIATDKFPADLQSPNVSSKKSFCEL